MGADTDPEENARLTAGLFHLQQIPAGGSFSLRLEALLYPDGVWEVPANSGTEGGGTDGRYALSPFPEVTWSPSESVALFGRVLVSPIDRSALWITGAEWNIYEGLTLGSFLTLQSGEVSDGYGFHREGGASLTASVRSVF